MTYHLIHVWLLREQHTAACGNLPLFGFRHRGNRVEVGDRLAGSRGAPRSSASGSSTISRTGSNAFLDIRHCSRAGGGSGGRLIERLMW